MASCIVISSNRDFVNSTAKLVEEHTYYNPIKFLLRENAYSHWADLFKYLTEKLSAIPFTNLRESIVLIDEYFDIYKSNPIESNIDINVFWGRMILAFPELEFIFLNKNVECSRTVIDWLENETSVLKNVPFISLFDFNGLRDSVRKNCNAELQKRGDSARIIEDEVSHAFFHAYIAYKRNYRSKLYTTLSHLEQDKQLKPYVELQIQDLSLGFVDKKDKPLKDLPQRYKEYPFLTHVRTDKDFLITVGDNLEKVNTTHLYVKKLQKTLKIIGKPSGNLSILLEGNPNNYCFTVFNHSKDVCQQCGLQTHDLEYCLKQIYKPTKGIYDICKKLNLSYSSSQNAVVIQDNNSHSAPGILALISEKLISRSQQILDSVAQVEDAVHAAILALEAKEILNGLTPTLALQALSLQQKAEVTAECLFVGTEYNIDLEPRFKDIKKEVEIITQRFADTERNRAQLNIQLKIVEILSAVYGNYKQFEEELKCLNKARNLNFKLKRKIFIPFLLLLSWSMNRVINFGFVLLMMQLLFAFCYFLLSNWNNDSTQISILDSFFASVKYFFTTETSSCFKDVFEKHERIGNVLHGFQGFCALSSLSIFTAMIFLRFSRK